MLIGKKNFHPICINWSYRYLGNAPLAQINKITNKQILIEKKKPEDVSEIFNQPPQNKIEFSADIINILLYSPKENKANCIPEYSTL